MRIETTEMLPHLSIAIDRRHAELRVPVVIDGKHVIIPYPLEPHQLASLLVQGQKAQHSIINYGMKTVEYNDYELASGFPEAKIKDVIVE